MAINATHLSPGFPENRLCIYLCDFLHCCQILIETINCRECVVVKILVSHNPFQLKGPYWIIVGKL